MDCYICTTCGTQYAPSAHPPSSCAICEDERQYVNPTGQQWTTLEKIQQSHRAVLKKKEAHLYGIGSTPSFGIGQRALLLTTPEGNLLWDCIAPVDDTLVDLINALGGLDAIAISHPHYYTTMVEWSRLFGHTPVYLHEKDRKWAQRESDVIHYWNGTSHKLFGDLTLYNPGGHFEGGAVLHWPDGANGKGALLTGDILQVVPDLKHVSFMYSYPNQIPLGAPTIKKMMKVLAHVDYDRIYGAWWNRNIPTGAKQAVRNSAERYLAAIQA